MYTIYAIYNAKHKKIYIGQTQDLKVRLAIHSSHGFKDTYTARYDGEWLPIYVEEVATRHEALKREKELKSFRGREYIKRNIPV